MSNVKYLKFSLLTLLVMSVILVSCDPTKKYYEQENEEIQIYLASNPNLSFEQKTSGLYYLEIQAGQGATAIKHDTAYIKYTGKFLNGTVFDTNVGKSDSLIFPVNEGWLIPGFDEAITYMKKGTKAFILIPSKLAYGPSGYYAISGFTPLLFDLELVDLKPGPGK